jgi:hypothetical protein
VSTTITGRTHHSIHVTYPDETYFVGILGRHFIDIDEAWHLVIALARDRDDMFSGPVTLEAWLRDIETSMARGQSRASSTSLSDPQWLRFERIHLSSPLDITFAVQAGGATGVTIYALHLLSAVMRDSERIGGWLPGLVKGWHDKQKEAAQARRNRQREASSDELTETVIEEHQRETERAEELAALSNSTAIELENLARRRLRDLKPVDVIIDTDSVTPEDIAEALAEAD